jgi:hypothetical protein
VLASSPDPALSVIVVYPQYEMVIARRFFKAAFWSRLLDLGRRKWLSMVAGAARAVLLEVT